MVLPVAPQLAALASRLRAEQVTSSCPWTVTRWQLDADAVQAAQNAYRELLQPSLPEHLLSIVRRSNSNVVVFPASTPHQDKITRADITELCSAAILHLTDEIPFALMSMPNVPKTSPRRSQQGIDVLCAHLTPYSDDWEPSADDYLVAVSVKHTIATSSRAAHKEAFDSTSPTTLHAAYLVEESRRLMALLELQGVPVQDSRRVYVCAMLAFTDHHTGPHIACVVAADRDSCSDLGNHLDIFTGGHHSTHALNQIEISNIATLHVLGLTES